MINENQLNFTDKEKQQLTITINRLKKSAKIDRKETCFVGKGIVKSETLLPITSLVKEWIEEDYL